MGGKLFPTRRAGLPRPIPCSPEARVILRRPHWGLSVRGGWLQWLVLEEETREQRMRKEVAGGGENGDKSKSLVAGVWLWRKRMNAWEWGAEETPLLLSSLCVINRSLDCTQYTQWCITSYPNSGSRIRLVSFSFSFSFISTVYLFVPMVYAFFFFFFKLS